MSAALTKMAQKIHRRLGNYLDRCGCRGLPDGTTKTTAYADEAEALATLLTGLGHHNTLESLLMLEVFLASGEHLTAVDFARLLGERGHEVTEEKAADTLELFRSLGFAINNYTEDGRALYEHIRPGLHHDHIICSGCGRTVEFNRSDVDGLIEKIACDENFSHIDHRLLIYGLCPACRRRRHDGLSLAETSVGEMVMVVGFKGSGDLKRRLRDLGLRRGIRLKVLGEQSGSAIVLFEGCRLAMGPEMAAGLIVRATGRNACNDGLRGGFHPPHHRHGKNH